MHSLEDATCCGLHFEELPSDRLRRHSRRRFARGRKRPFAQTSRPRTSPPAITSGGRRNSERHLRILSGRSGRCRLSRGSASNPTTTFRISSKCTKNLAELQRYLMQALGFDDESRRPDRDDYVRFNWSALPAKVRRMLEPRLHPLPWTRAWRRPDGSVFPYDYLSLMHPPAEVPGLPGGGALLRAVVPLPAGVVMGARERLSQLDLERLRTLYSCSGTLCPTRVYNTCYIT